MNHSAAVYGTVALVAAVTLASGPAVGLIDLTSPRIGGSDLGQGTATVDAVEAPSTVALDRGYQSESYYLRVPDAHVRVAEISGRPLIAYRLEIEAMNYSRTTTHFLGPEDEGRVALSLARDTFTDDAVTRDGYEGRLSIVLRGDEETVLSEETVAVEVTE